MISSFHHIIVTIVQFLWEKSVIVTDHWTAVTSSSNMNCTSSHHNKRIINIVSHLLHYLAEYPCTFFFGFWMNVLISWKGLFHIFFYFDPGQLKIKRAFSLVSSLVLFSQAIRLEFFKNFSWLSFLVSCYMTLNMILKISLLFSFYVWYFFGLTKGINQKILELLNTLTL